MMTSPNPTTMSAYTVAAHVYKYLD